MAKREAVFRPLMSKGWTALRHGALVPFLFILPFLFGIGGKLYRSRLWFGDYQAMACAGEKVQAHQPFYDIHLSCPGMHASSFVYIPAIADLFAGLERLIGEPGVFGLYLLLFVAGLAVLVAGPLRWAPGTWRDKLPFTVFIGGSAVMWGNVAVPLHALILGAALCLESAPWLFVAAVVLAAAVKPVFLTYLAVVLLTRRSWLQRMVLITTGVAAGLAPTLWFAFSDPGTAFQWAQLLSHFVYDVTPGSGFYGWLSFLGARSDTLLAQASYLVYAGVLAFSALYAAFRLKLDDQSRLWLGLSVATLLIPRIMSQDVFLLGPGLVLVARHAADLADSRAAPEGRLTRALLRHGPAVVWGLCLMALVFGTVEHSRYSTPLALLGFSLYLIALGGALARDGLARAVETRRTPWADLAPARERRL